MLKIAGVALAVLAMALVGCSGPSDHDHSAHETGPAEHAGSNGMHDADGGADAASVPAGMNPECPVMGGETDAEVFTEYAGKKVYFCCDDCIATFKEDPEKYFAKAYPGASSR